MTRAEFDYGLWRGPAPASPGDVAGFDLVVCLRAWDFVAIERERLWCQKGGAFFRHVPMSPIFPPSRDQIDGAVELLITARKGRLKTLVHCDDAGHRTGFVVAAYRQIRQGWGWIDINTELLYRGFRRLWRPFLRAYLASRRED